MCGRYKLSAKSEGVWAHFDLHGEQLPLLPRFNIAPTQPVAIIRQAHQLEVVRWGLKLASSNSGWVQRACREPRGSVVPLLHP